MIDQPSLAILIDCWYLGRFKKTSVSEVVYPNIINFLETNQNIKTVALASYNCRNEFLSNRLWYNNYRDFFDNEKNSRKIRDLAVVHNVHRHQDNKFPNEHTDPMILNYRNDNQYQIAMWWGWELEYYLSLNPHIKNVYVLGLAWDQCVKIRPLGYEALSEIPNINVLTKVDCSANMNASAVELDSNPNWQKIEEKIYCLKYAK